MKKPPLAKPGEPLALLEKHGNIRRIAALDDAAIDAGLYPHQPLADALAVYPALISADAEPEADREALTALAIWARRYSPATAPAPPYGLWLDITGCAHLWGGEAKLAEEMLDQLKRWDIPARAAIASTFGAAYALAHHANPCVIVPANPYFAHSHAASIINANPENAATLIRGLFEKPNSVSDKLLDKASFRDGVVEYAEDENRTLLSLLAPLPVERLRISNETCAVLRKLGLFTIGDVHKLPRSGVSRRFPDLLPQFDKAMGLAEEAIDFLRPPTPWIERLRFAEPVSAPEDLERITAKLLEMLCARLQVERQGGMRFEVSFFRADGGVQSQTVSTALPTRDGSRVFRLFREKLGLIDPGFGIDLAMLAALHVEPLKTRQTNLMRSVQSAACVEELAALIDSLENRLGAGRVYRRAPLESYAPERAVQKQPVIPETPKALFGIKNTKHAVRKDHGYRQTGSAMTLAMDQGEDIWRRMGERPIRLFERPQPIDVTAALPDAPPMLFRWRKVLHRIARADGPERISSEWWRGADDGQVRDYYRVENTQGLRFWVFREGLYGGNRLPQWYLHGVFA